MPPAIPTPSSNPHTPTVYAYNSTESESSSARSSSTSETRAAATAAVFDPSSSSTTTNGHNHHALNTRALPLSSPRSRSLSKSKPAPPPQSTEAPGIVVASRREESITSKQQSASMSSATSSPTTNFVTFTASSLEALKNLPEKRELPWRPGQELPDEYEFKRPQQKGAVFLAARGEVQSRPCRVCQNENGRFTLCVALDQYFGGACASCVFPSKGSQCSLRRDREDGEFFYLICGNGVECEG